MGICCFVGKHHIYIMLSYAKLNDKEYDFFRNSGFHATCATIFGQMNFNDQIYYNLMVRILNDVTAQDMGKSPLLS